MNKPTVILGVIGSDCHSVGNKILDAFFSKEFTVVNLGVMVSQEEFIDAAIENQAVALLVSSLYGHAELDCAGFRERCVENKLHHIRLYVGGNLLIGKADRDAVRRKFEEEMKFDRVFFPNDDLEDVAKALKSDLRERPAASPRPEGIPSPSLLPAVSVQQPGNGLTMQSDVPGLGQAPAGLVPQPVGGSPTQSSAPDPDRVRAVLVQQSGGRTPVQTTVPGPLTPDADE